MVASFKNQFDLFGQNWHVGNQYQPANQAFECDLATTMK